MSEAAEATSRLLVVADQLLEKLLDHNLQFSQQTGAGQIVDDLMTELRRLSAELDALKKAMGEPVAWLCERREFGRITSRCVAMNYQEPPKNPMDSVLPLYALTKDKT